MTGPAPRYGIPTRAEREARNAALLATDAETGFWDDHGRPAPWPDDIEDWAPDVHEPRQSTFQPASTKPGASPIP